jgi:hypothetical protein
VWGRSGFSKAGLIQQLSSPAGEGYSKADAKAAANHVDADWNAGETFTPAQARYAANKAY